MESNLNNFGVRKYESFSGRFTSIDPLWEKYCSWSPYVYSGNSPVIAKDGSGFELIIVGTQKEVTKLFSGLSLVSGTKLFYEKEFVENKQVLTTITGFESVDNRFHNVQNKLKDIIESDETIYLKIDNEGEVAFYGGGCYDEVENKAKISKDPSSYFYESSTPLEGIAGSFGVYKHKYYDFFDLIGHELLGHGWQDVMNLPQSESVARDVERSIQKKRGKDPRR